MRISLFLITSCYTYFIFGNSLPMSAMILDPVSQSRSVCKYFRLKWLCTRFIFCCCLLDGLPKMNAGILFCCCYISVEMFCRWAYHQFQEEVSTQFSIDQLVFYDIFDFLLFCIYRTVCFIEVRLTRHVIKNQISHVIATAGESKLFVILDRGWSDNFSNAYGYSRLSPILTVTHDTHSH